MTLCRHIGINLPAVNVLTYVSVEDVYVHDDQLFHIRCKCWYK